ncbi:MAG: 50S ribosomal protein L10 [Thermodesulfobacteriota bacterium]
MNRAEKAEVIQKLQQEVNSASIALVTDFRGLKVEEMEDLRGRLKDNNVSFQVVKNTLVKLALQDSPHDVIKDDFKDCCALALGYDDPVVAAKVLAEFAKVNKKFELRFGSYEGQKLSADDIINLSRLPGREELLAQLLRTCNAVPTNFVGLFANLLRNLLYALQGIHDQKAQS